MLEATGHHKVYTAGAADSPAGLQGCQRQNLDLVGTKSKLQLSKTASQQQDNMLQALQRSVYVPGENVREASTVTALRRAAAVC